MSSSSSNASGGCLEFITDPTSLHSITFTVTKTLCLIFVWLCSCEQNSSQTKSDPLPDITKRFKRYQDEANDRESAPTKKKETAPARKNESAHVRKQTKSSSSIKEPSQKRLAAAKDDENAQQQQSELPVCTGKQWSLSLMFLYLKVSTAMIIFSEPILPHCMECIAVLQWEFRPSVRMSVRPFVPQTRELWQNGRKICLDFYMVRKIIYPSFLRRRMVGGGDPFYLKFWVNRPALERNRRFWTDNRS